MESAGIWYAVSVLCGEGGRGGGRGKVKGEEGGRDKSYWGWSSGNRVFLKARQFSTVFPNCWLPWLIGLRVI